MFFGFAFIGYVLNGLIPAEWVSAVFGTGNSYSVPLAATFGIPFYLNTEASLPLLVFGTLAMKSISSPSPTSPSRSTAR